MHKFPLSLVCITLIAASFHMAAAQPTSPRNVVAASPAVTNALTAQLARFFGTRMTFTECQSRMSDLETMLGTSGFGRRSMRSQSDGSMSARWYNPTRDLTVMAVASPSDDGQGFAFDAYAMEGRVRWAEYLPLPY